MQLTVLEEAILERYREAYAHRGFPAPRDISVWRRERRDAVNSVYLYCREGGLKLPDCRCDLPNDEILQVQRARGRSQIDISVFIVDGRPAAIEMVRQDGRLFPRRLANWRLTTALSVDA